MIKSCLQCWETWVQSLVWEDSLEQEMATHSSILAWRTLWMEETGGYLSALYSLAPAQSRPGSAAEPSSRSFWKPLLPFPSFPNPFPCLRKRKLTSPSPNARLSQQRGKVVDAMIRNFKGMRWDKVGNLMDKGAWEATVHGVAKSQTQLSTHIHTHT